MQVKFAPECTLPIAAAVGDEIGNVVGGNDDSYEVEFPIYGAGFSLPAECFTVVDDDTQ